MPMHVEFREFECITHDVAHLAHDHLVSNCRFKNETRFRVQGVKSGVNYNAVYNCRKGGILKSVRRGVMCRTHRTTLECDSNATPTVCWNQYTRMYIYNMCVCTMQVKCIA